MTSLYAHVMAPSRARAATRLRSIPPAAGCALGLAAVDAAGQALIAHRLPGESHVSLFGVVMVAVVLGAMFSAAERIRGRDALLLCVPAGALGVIGHLVDVRMRAGGVTGIQGGQFIAAVFFCCMLGLLASRRRVEALAPLLGYIGVALIALPLLPGIGEEVGGQRINASIGVVHGQPGELGRPLILVGMAAWLRDLPLPAGARLALADIREKLGVALIPPVLGVGFSLIARDLGPAMLLAGATLLLVLVVTGRRRHLLLLLAGIAALLLVGLILAQDRIVGRIDDLLHPMRFEGSYDQTAIARMWLAWGHVWGVGLGGGIVNPLQGASVPAGDSDMVLVTWGMEMGLAGLMAALALVCALIWALFTFGLRAPAGFWRLAGVGLATLMTCQIIWVVGATCGLLPLTGVPIPLVSTGRSAAIGLAFSCAFAVRLPRHDGAEVRVRDVDPRQMIVLLRAAAASVIVFSGIALIGMLHDNTSINRMGDNHPIRNIEGLRRGKILDHGGRLLASSTGLASMQTFARSYDHASVRDLVGRMNATTRGDGLEGAWSAPLRCAGSNQADPNRPSLKVVGNPASCDPADMVLSLDLRAQRAARSALGNRAGAVIVMDARDGAVLAMAGHHPAAPDRPANLWLGARTAVAPGSTFKIVTAAAVRGAANAVSLPGSTPWASEFQAPGGAVVHNAGGQTCGGTLAEAFATSCNTSFARLALEIGSFPLAMTASTMGMHGETPLSGLPTVPSRGPDHPSTPAEVAAAGFGQGTVTATPLALARMTATVANGGTLVTPGLVDLVCAGGDRLALPQHQLPRKAAITPKRAYELTLMMRAVATVGSGQRLRLAGDWALKTGTAELPAIASAMSPAGTAGLVVAFPTTGPAAGRLAVAVLVLPGAKTPLRWGGRDGVDVLQAVGPAAVEALQRRRRHRPECP